MIGTHGCGERVRWVIVGSVTVPVEVEPHSAGMIAVPVSGRLGYQLSRDRAPGVSYRRHRRHECRG